MGRNKIYIRKFQGGVNEKKSYFIGTNSEYATGKNKFSRG